MSLKKVQSGEPLRIPGGDREIPLQLSALPNMTASSVGDVTGVSKRGWGHIWVRRVDTVDDGVEALVKKPRHVYVEKVYDDGDFSGLGSGT